MKNLLLIIIMFIGALTMSSAQTVNEVVSTVDSVSKEIPKYQEVTEYYMEKTKEAIEGLAQALEVPAKEVWRILVTQQIANSITWLIILTISLYFTLRIFGWITLVIDLDEKEYAKKMKIGEDGDGSGIGIINGLGLLLSAIVFIVACFHIDTIVTGFINPEYGALMEIKDYFK